jgi:hypothetical protein
MGTKGICAESILTESGILKVLSPPSIRRTTWKKNPLDRGFFAAGNNQYHGVESVKEFGILDHANQVARILLRDKKVSTEEDALVAAHLEIQHMRLAAQGYQVNRLARDELRRVRDKGKVFVKDPLPSGA